ncbi:hypothetical protein AB0H69_43780 [Streptomyces phaeochromogenes]|uniref:hypothetical protein n=1 Tax=Streptomyces phaeochromogenes TaxID=1923 RepID=UPI00340B0EB6
MMPRTETPSRGSGDRGASWLWCAGVGLAPGLSAGSASFADYGWGALSGVGTGVGVAFLYRAMSQGAMSVVVPVSDVGAVALPVLVGVTLLGEHLSAPVWVGIAAVLPALWLVSQDTPGAARERRGAMSDGVPSALVASVGIGLQFLAMAWTAKAVCGRLC